MTNVGIHFLCTFIFLQKMRNWEILSKGLSIQRRNVINVFVYDYIET